MQYEAGDNVQQHKSINNTYSVWIPLQHYVDSFISYLVEVEGIMGAIPYIF